MRSKSLSGRIFDTFNVTFLVIVSIATFFPIYYTVVLSFTDPIEYYKEKLILFPKMWSLDAYKTLLTTNTFPSAFGISTFLAAVGTAISLIVTSGLAYAVSRRRLRFRRFIMFLLMFSILFQPGLIPSYLVVRQLGLIDSIWSLILPVMTSGWYVLLMKGFFDSIPDSLEEAARIDGANEIGIWFRIILPLSLPSLVAFGLFYAVGYWNTYFNALIYINDFQKWPLQVVLQNMLIDPASATGNIDFRSSKQMPTETLKMAAVVIATVPIMLVYPFLQKHFAKGAMVGSVKE
ncbi:carbohydrate ABC transporter permease [Paenibacillus alkaliterrae]|uniref:carbohydrate ABC transporter permease n=1 Tax=Paenibacillus alkaliterrae TaxID=320909 RepID=UPI001F181696|nr:carbohydrate ABC transporter permease [Paenibacillus alkaliterrae]MCF2938654.1 carbohydrate ABC transporter permease [Paenibacillus alkaliterrae]